MAVNHLFLPQAYSEYVSQFPGSAINEFMHTAGGLQARFDQARDRYDIQRDALEAVSALPLSQDQAYKKKLIDTFTQELDQFAQREDFENMGREINMSARRFAQAVQPLQQRQQEVAEFRKSLSENKDLTEFQRQAAVRYSLGMSDNNKELLDERFTNEAFSPLTKFTPSKSLSVGDKAREIAKDYIIREFGGPGEVSFFHDENGTPLGIQQTRGEGRRISFKDLYGKVYNALKDDNVLVGNVQEDMLLSLYGTEQFSPEGIMQSTMQSLDSAAKSAADIRAFQDGKTYQDFKFIPGGYHQANQANDALKGVRAQAVGVSQYGGNTNLDFNTAGTSSPFDNQLKLAELDVIAEAQSGHKVPFESSSAQQNLEILKNKKQEYLDLVANTTTTDKQVQRFFKQEYPQWENIVNQATGLVKQKKGEPTKEYLRRVNDVIQSGVKLQNYPVVALTPDNVTVREDKTDLLMGPVDDSGKRNFGLSDLKGKPIRIEENGKIIFEGSYQQAVNEKKLHPEDVYRYTGELPPTLHGSAVSMVSIEDKDRDGFSGAKSASRTLYIENTDERAAQIDKPLVEGMREVASSPLNFGFTSSQYRPVEINGGFPYKTFGKDVIPEIAVESFPIVADKENGDPTMTALNRYVKIRYKINGTSDYIDESSARSIGLPTRVPLEQYRYDHTISKYNNMGDHNTARAVEKNRSNIFLNK